MKIRTLTIATAIATGLLLTASNINSVLNTQGEAPQDGVEPPRSIAAIALPAAKPARRSTSLPAPRVDAAIARSTEPTSSRAMPSRWAVSADGEGCNAVERLATESKRRRRPRSEFVSG